MANKKEPIGIIAADLVAGGLLIHFTNETATLFHSQFLFDVRNEDHNVPIAEEGKEVSG
jgi:hypothetical protein